MNVIKLKSTNKDRELMVEARRFPPPWTAEVTPNCTNSMPAPMPATCDGGGNDTCDEQNEDDNRYIFHDALRAGNIGTQNKTTGNCPTTFGNCHHTYGSSIRHDSSAKRANFWRDTHMF